MKTVVSTNSAPVAVGPYSQAIAWDKLVFCSGQIPLDPNSRMMVKGAIEDEMRRALENLQAVIEASGSSMERVLKTTVFLTDLNFFENVNSVYAEFFPTDAPPARSTIQVAALPKGARVEVEAIAAKA